MSNLNPAPIQEPMLEPDGYVRMPWALFFNSLFQGDTGSEWEPEFSNLTEVGGAATITGFYRFISRELVYFRVIVTPVTNTSATAGTTTIDNFPLTINSPGACLAVANGGGTQAGMISPGDQKIYVPAWTTVTNPVTIIGIAEAS